MGLPHEMDLAFDTCMVSFRPKYSIKPMYKKLALTARNTLFVL